MSAGADNGSLKTVEELEKLAADLGRPAGQRSSADGPVTAERRARAAVFVPPPSRPLPLVGQTRQEAQ